jgi:hypothetical protein
MYKGNGVDGRRGLLVRDNWKKNWLITAVSFSDSLRNWLITAVSLSYTLRNRLITAVSFSDTPRNWLITAVSFSDTLRNPDYVASDRRMNLNSELEKKYKNSAMLHFSALY